MKPILFSDSGLMEIPQSVGFNWNIPQPQELRRPPAPMILDLQHCPQQVLIIRHKHSRQYQKGFSSYMN